MMVGDEGAAVVLEMHERPRVSAPRPHRTGMLLRVDQPTVRFYRYLSESAAGRWPWTEMRSVPDDVLAEVLFDDAVEFFALYLGGEPVGCFELQAGRSDVELIQIGMVPEHRGSELERYLLAAGVDTAWDHEPEKVWARIDGEADPHYLLLYQRAGFQVTGTAERRTCE